MGGQQIFIPQLDPVYVPTGTQVTQDLGLVAAIIFGLLPPTNTKVLWYNENVNLHYRYNVTTSTWIPLVDTTGTGGPAGSSLPDQTGFEGEYLQTDGKDASWQKIQEYLRFNTLADLNAYNPVKPIEVGQPARVVDDPATTNNGNYTALADGNGWVKDKEGTGIEYLALNLPRIEQGKYYEFTLSESPRIWRAKATQVHNSSYNYTVPVETDATANGGAYWIEISRTIAQVLPKNYGGLGNNSDGFINQKELSVILNNKVDKVNGKGLSTNDYTTAEKQKLAAIPGKVVVTVNGQGPDANGAVNIPITNGDDGLSAYEIWINNGNRGTEAEFLQSLKGANGTSYTLLPDSILNSHLGTDVKVGSVSAAGNAYPAADRAGLTTVEKFLVWIGPKVTDLYTRLGGLDSGLSSLTALVNGFAARITALEARPTGAAGAGGGGTSPAGATVPPGGTTGQVLTKTSNADGAAAWQTPNAGNAVAWDYALGNTSAPPPIDFRRATQLTLVGRSSGIASASYAVNGGSPQPFVFTNNLDQRGISIPAGGQLVLSAVNFQGGAPSGTLFLEGTQS